MPGSRRSLIDFINEYEMRAKRRGNRVYRIYAKLPARKRARADKILDDLADGKLTYWQALEKLRRLAGESG